MYTFRSMTPFRFEASLPSSLAARQLLVEEIFWLLDMPTILPIKPNEHPCTL